VATLLDAYWGFIAFYVWVAWKERSPATRLLWFPSLILLGNLAIAAYMLRELFSIPAKTTRDAALEQVFTRRNAGGVVLPGLLTAIAAIVYCLA
jgi:hypothetical protein